MVKLAARHPDVVAAAMPDGTGLKRFRKAYPERFFDVGIAEEHAVTFADRSGGWRTASGCGDLFFVFAACLRPDFTRCLSAECSGNLAVDHINGSMEVVL